MQSAKSHRIKSKNPKYSVELAELLGIIFGDGGINNEWQVVVSLNSEKDAEYASYVSYLFSLLFGIGVRFIKIKNQNTLRVVCSSMNVVDFLVSAGATRGNKLKNGLHVPQWIVDDLLYSRAFVRGLVDTDGCIFIHQHNVADKLRHNIGFCFTSYSENVINFVENVLANNGITGHIADKNRRIYLYSTRAINDYVKIFGTSNQRIAGVFNRWVVSKKFQGEFA